MPNCKSYWNFIRFSARRKNESVNCNKYSFCEENCLGVKFIPFLSFSIIYHNLCIDKSN